MKKLILLFLVVFFAGFASAGSVCCDKGCYDNPQGGYTVKCCSAAGIPEQEGTAYLGCLGVEGGVSKSYCLNDMFGDCLQCQYIGGIYQWVNLEDTKCDKCKVCECDGIDTPCEDIDIPTTAECIFDTLGTKQYNCIDETHSNETNDICLVKGGSYEDSCCTQNDINPDDGYGDIVIRGLSLCSPYSSGGPTYSLGDTCYYDRDPTCSDIGWQCTTPSQDTDVDYTDCYTKGNLIDENEIATDDISDDTCYYTDREITCTQDDGWQCASGSSCKVDECSGQPPYQPDSDNDGIPDVCDTEATQEDCTDGKDNDGDGLLEGGGCDINGGSCCQDTNGNGVCDEGETHTMSKDPGCIAEICTKCTVADFCSETKCESDYYKSSTGHGSCYFRGYLQNPINPCCDDYDDDDVCDSADNCWREYNPAQGDNDDDGLGNECDDCPNIKQTETTPLSDDDSTILCTGTEEKICFCEETCTDSDKCDIINVKGEDFFCNGDRWVDRNFCDDCFYYGDNEYYWIDNYDQICDLTTPGKLETDKSDIVCEILEGGSQEECEEGETACWASDAAPATYTQCCGDDENDDTWIDTNNQACSEGTFFTDPDDLKILCELVTNYEATCSHGNICWSDKCCGDDDEVKDTWIYSSDDFIRNLLVDTGCYNSRWFDIGNAKVTYYELLIVP